MARASTAAENRAISGVFAASTPTPSTTAYWMSLHTGDPGTTGASEYAGVTRLQFPAGHRLGWVAVEHVGAELHHLRGVRRHPHRHLGRGDRRELRHRRGAGLSGDGDVGAVRHRPGFVLGDLIP
jgi:hypothetical protein